MARFPRCAVVTHWLPHTPVQIFFRLILVHKKVWCSLSSLSKQSGILAMTFHITLICAKRLFMKKIMNIFCSKNKALTT